MPNMGYLESTDIKYISLYEVMISMVMYTCNENDKKSIVQERIFTSTQSRIPASTECPGVLESTSHSKKYYIWL